MADKIPSVDELIKQQDRRSEQQLQQQLDRGNSAIDQAINDGIQALSNQYNIKRNYIRKLFDNERDPKRKAAIEQQMFAIKTQFEGKFQAVRDKFVSPKRKLTGAFKAEMQKMQAAIRERDIRIKTIRQQTDAGRFNSKAMAQQAEYEAIGIDIPLSELEVAAPSLQSRKAAVERDIVNIDKTLKYYSPESEKVLSDPGWAWWGKKKAKIFDSVTGEVTKLDPENPKHQIIIDEMQALIDRRKTLTTTRQELLIEGDARFRAPIERSQQWADASKKLTGGDRPNIETGVMSALDKANKGRNKTGKTNDLSQLSIEELRRIVEGR